MRFTILAEQQNSVVAVFARHTATESAIQLLEKGGFDTTQLSIIGRDFYSEDGVFGFYTTGEHIRYWGKLGAFWSRLWGLLVGAAFLIVPGMGPVIVAGRIASWIVGPLETAIVIGGLTAIGSGLVSLGMSRDSVLEYETSLKMGKYLLIAHGAMEELGKAFALLKASAAEQVELHHLAAEGSFLHTHAA